MGKIATIIKVATVAGPAVLKIIQTYGPQLKQIVDDHPELAGTIKKRISLVSHTKSNGGSVSGVATNIGVLRDQVTYLYASANTPAVATQASAWRAELDALETLLPVIGTMSKKAQKTELKAIQVRIDSLSTSILAATIRDDVEDAEMIIDSERSSSEDPNKETGY